MKTTDCKKHPIIRGVILIIGIVFLIWFIIPLFTNVMVNIGMLTGIGVFALLTLYGIFFYPVNSFLSRLWKSKAERAIEIIVAAMLGVILILACITYGCMLHVAGKKPEPNATVLVLGCKVNGYHPSLTLLSRLNAGLDYLEENTDSICIVSGAQGRGEITTEAGVMYQWYLDHGISKERLLLEDKATDTEENIAYSLNLLGAHPDCSSKLVLVTNDFHMYRALRTAKEQGCIASPLSAKTPWWLYPTYVVREMYGILESWFLK